MGNRGLLNWLLHAECIRTSLNYLMWIFPAIMYITEKSSGRVPIRQVFIPMISFSFLLSPTCAEGRLCVVWTARPGDRLLCARLCTMVVFSPQRCYSRSSEIVISEGTNSSFLFSPHHRRLYSWIPPASGSASRRNSAI